VCIAIPAVVEFGLGVVYFTASEVMPYHKEALGVEWSQLEPGVRTLLLTFVNGYGSAHLAVGIALTALLLFPLRQGQVWARWTILAIGFPVLGATAYLSTRLAMTTGAGVPWQGAVVLLVLFVVGVALADPKAAARPVDAPDQ
jgi:type II secretory pathway component PulF